MASVCFYFQVHQPMRLKRYRVFDIGHDHDYFTEHVHDKINNEKILHKVAHKGYLPTNAILLDLLKKHPQFRISFSLSGIFLEQLEMYAPHVLESFQALVKTGQVELLGETYYHSLSFLYSKDEFKRQVKMHSKKIRELFKVTPKVFRNTELIYNNDVAKAAEELGFKGIIAEGVDRILGWRTPNFVYKSAETQNLRLLLKNYRLSDDIAFRFSSKAWSEYPLTAPKFGKWVSDVNGNGNIINLFMDYETFGEHQWADTGIFEFLKHLPGEILKHPDNNFVTPSEAIQRYDPVAEISIPYFISWADTERDLSAWLSNAMQHDAIQKVYSLEKKVLATKDEKLISDWRRLQTSDHYYYMCTKWWADGDVHKYFSPYDSPYDAFITCMNVLQDLELRIGKAKSKKTPVRSGTIKSYSASYASN